ncbi:UNVERIFIED_ORG: hypothetical protein J2811_005157 [Burkholderia cepacia]|nr:hypothetical protein [Burkholderia cepacia]MDP9597493.1 hypothetical protein [Burkholderia cepacia]MDP9625688.1 hypothetical protein [Burkholderia cepacia]MDP9671923.1 hypothetical protein [Burkholderia cepacia]MDP9718196.1 hypothetical protein [Burkholderia cepacia]
MSNAIGYIVMGFLLGELLRAIREILSGDKHE